MQHEHRYLVRRNEVKPTHLRKHCISLECKTCANLLEIVFFKSLVVFVNETLYAIIGLSCLALRAFCFLMARLVVVAGFLCISNALVLCCVR